jgi:uncharacterized protein
MMALTILIKPVSGRCDLACSYCFYRDVASRRDRRDYGLMDPVTMEALIARAFEDEGREIQFVFQGGEPCLAGIGFYRDFVRAVERLGKPGTRVAYSIQTNGMTVDGEWAAFLKAHNFLVGISLDGPRVLHDASRRSPDGRGSHGRVLESVRILKEAGVEFNILCVVNSLVADNPRQVYEYLRRRGFGWIQFIPCMDPFPDKTGVEPPTEAAGQAPSPKAWASFLKTCFDLWSADLAAGNFVSVRYFDNLVAMAMGRPPESCAMAGRCGSYFAVEADGTVFPCDFYEVDEWSLGNVLDASFGSMRNSELARRFVGLSESRDSECQGCFALSLCRGGCMRDREPFIQGLPGRNKFCAAYKEFLAYAGERIVDLARSLPRD